MIGIDLEREASAEIQRSSNVVFLAGELGAAGLDVGPEQRLRLAKQVVDFWAFARTDFAVPSKEIDAVWHFAIEQGLAPSEIIHYAGYPATAAEMKATMDGMRTAGYTIYADLWSEVEYCGGGGGNTPPPPPR